MAKTMTAKFWFGRLVSLARKFIIVPGNEAQSKRHKTRKGGTRY